MAVTRVMGCRDSLCPMLEGEGPDFQGQVTPLHQKPVKRQVCVHALIPLSGSCRHSSPPPFSASEDAELRGFKFKIPPVPLPSLWRL